MEGLGEGDGSLEEVESDEEMGRGGKKTTKSKVKPSQTEQCAEDLGDLNLNNVYFLALCSCCVTLHLTCPSSLSV